MTTHRTRSRKISSVASAALTLLVLTGSVGHLDHLARPWSEFLCISLRVGIETLPSICLGAWQISALSTRPLEGPGEPPQRFRVLLADRADSRSSGLAGASLSKVQAPS